MALGFAAALAVIVGALVAWQIARAPVGQAEGPPAWVVSRTQAAAAHVFPTIRQALDKAQPGDRILVRDEDHEECLEILHGERGRGVSVESAAPSGRPVVWRAPAGMGKDNRLLDLAQVEGMTVKGFVLDGGNHIEELVRLEGACPGLAIEQVRFQGFSASAVRLEGCGGSAEHPVRLVELWVASQDARAAGLSLCGPVCRHVEVRGCTFLGPMQTGVGIAAAVAQVRVSQNRFHKATNGILFQSGALDPVAKIDWVVASNTFHTVEHGLRVDGVHLTNADSKVELSNNLFAGSSKLAHADLTPPERDKNARWIAAPPDWPPGPRYFLASYPKTTNAPFEAIWELYCDDDFQAWCNGMVVARHEPGRRYYRIDITEAVQKNASKFERLAILCENSGGRAGLLSQVSYDHGGGPRVVHWSEGHFYVARAAKPGAPVAADEPSFRESVGLKVGPLRVTGAIGNVCDAGSREGNLGLQATITNVVLLGLDPQASGTFLRYAATDALAKAGFQGVPVGVPPAEWQPGK